MEPWEIVPAFTAERLRVLAELLVAIRRNALRSHAPSEGDTNWGLGCRVYERTCFAIEQAGKRYDWLTVLEQPLHFVFLVDGVPLRFARGDPDDPNPRLLRGRRNEEVAQQLAFSFTEDPDFFEWRWRLIVETDDATLEASQVFLVQVASDGTVGNQWALDWGGDKLVSAGKRPPKDPFEPEPLKIRPKSPTPAQTAG